MYTLGINGWIEKGHDASACLFKDDKLICFAEEERFSRKKHAYDSMPHSAIKFCLNKGKISLTKLDFVVLSWDYPKLYGLAKKKFYSSKDLIEIIFPKKIFGELQTKIIFVDHHLSHASSAFRCSGFESSTILVIDGQGEDVSTSIWKGEGNKIKLVKRFKIKDSLGYLYESANSFLGFHLDDSGKTMGLSSYGKGRFLQEKIKLDDEGYSFNIKPRDSNGLDSQKEIVELWLDYFTKKFGNKNRREYFLDKEYSILRYDLKFNKKYKDFAASIQKTINHLIIHLAKISKKLTKSKNLCIAGGVGLNCVANGKLLEKKIFDNLFVQPICNDAGTSLGAAMEFIARKGVYPNFKMKDVYFGPSFTNNEIESILNKRKIKYRYFKNISKKTAQLLAEGKIIGWFQGKMEAGPRALGNRSILANPCDPKLKDIVNKIKLREKWRPLCPSILEEAKEEYMEYPHESPFMILNFKIKKEKLKKIPSVIHVDRTARIQTVSKNINSLFWKLIFELGKITGEAVVLNTSLNSKGEPIACSPKDAINNFYSSGMDALVLGNFLIEK